MDVHTRIVSSIVVLLLLICLAMLLKRLGVLEENDSFPLSRLVTQVTLPALIFVSLASTDLAWREGELALFMAAATLICLAVGWLISRLLALDHARSGAVILVTGFGSSSLLGFALVSEVFPGDDQALAEAAIISGLGVQPALFTLGAMIALHYGSKEAGSASLRRTALRYFCSPIFIAFVAGLILSSALQETAHPTIESILDGVQVVGAANTFIVTLTVGLLLQVRPLNDVALIAALVSVVKLGLMPVLVWAPTFGLEFLQWQVEVLVLEAAMPSATLAVVFSSSYGCDARLASKLVFATSALSVVTVPLFFDLLT